MLNKTTDIIRTNNCDYININSNNRLIQQMVSADNVYSFGIRFGSKVDKETATEMEGTYWASTQGSIENIEDAQIVIL